MRHSIPIELEVLTILDQCGCTDSNDLNTILEFLDGKNIVVTIEATTTKRPVEFCYYVAAEQDYHCSVAYCKTRQDAYSAGINHAVLNYMNF